MSDIIRVLDALSLMALVTAGLFLWRGRTRLLRADIVVLLASTLVLMAFCSAMEWLGASPAMETMEGFAKVLVPFFWAHFLYSFGQGGARRDEEAQERKYRILVENLPQRVFFKDCNSVFVSVNERFAQDFGRRAEDLVGKTDLDIVPDELAEKFRADDRRVMANRQPETLVEKTLLQGRERTVEVVKAPVLDDDGRLIGLLGIFNDVTERVEAEEALRKARDRAQNYLDVAGVILLALSKEGKVTMINRKGCHVLGYTEEELVGRDWFATCLPEGIRAEIRQVFDGLVQGETSLYEYSENPVLTKDGQERQIAWHNTIVKDAAGTITGTLSSGEDVTARRRAEAALVESEQRFRRLAETALDGINMCELDPVTGARRLIFCNDRFVEMSGYTREQLEACDDLNQLVTSLPYPEGSGFIPPHIPNGEPRYGMASWKRPDGKENALEWSAVSMMSGDINVIYGFDHDVTERQQARRALLSSERQYRTTIEAMGDAICVLDRDCRVELANRAFEALSRRAGRQGEIVGENLFALLPFVPEEVRDDYRRVFEEGKVIVTESTYVMNGEEITVEVRKIPIFEGDTVVRAISVARDVTARRQAETALEKTQREEAAVLNAMSEAVIFYDTNLVMLWANRAAARALGADPSTKVGKKCKDIWQDGMADCSACKLALAVTEGGPQEIEARAPGSGGLWQVRRYPVVDGQGRLQGVVDVALDITERKRFEESLAQWAAVAESTDDAMFAALLDGTIIRWNPGAARIYGYSAEEVLGSCMLMLAPEERRAELKRVFTNVASGERVQQYETANLTRKGDLINVAITMSPALDEAGQITSISVIARDITEHIKLREELINLSLVDALTGLNNRRGFFHLAHQQLKVARRTQTAALLIFADVDSMKWINDSLGHKAGDRALVEAAGVLRKTFRESDIIGRIGGDEFAVLAIEAGAAGSRDILARLQRTLEARNAQPNREFQLSLSVGVVDCQPDETRSFDDIMAEADTRMYEHKRSKKPARPGVRETL
jgi:diguanylate cyclase (GGDEF)-like protein/PAS domain S-box-containing protein